MNVSLREIAVRLGLSASTISRALHRDPRVRPATALRIMAALKAQGYQLDPVVSAGMSKIRQKQFYRETLVWCGDAPRERMPWLAPLFQAMEDYGARLGYGFEYSHFRRATPRELARMASIWRARGIRGVLLGPFIEGHVELPFPWDGLAWVTIGHALAVPVLHSVGRDYATDIDTALDWLRSRGCHRPCHVLDAGVGHLFRRPLLEGALFHYHGAGSRLKEPFYELDAARPEHFEAWFKANRPDGVILPRSLREPLRQMTAVLDGLPRVLLSTPDRVEPAGTAFFTARYEVIGQAAVNLLHRLLSNREFGLPAYRQTVALSSVWSGGE
ncbi:MAG TPA: LacI family DNA-binding transcriptional regulator [Rariglobus sp.]